MTYFVTGATGFIGRHLVEELLRRQVGPIYVAVRPGSLRCLELLRRGWTDGHRVVPLEADLSAHRLGIDDIWIAEHAGAIDHVFHLGAIYDMTAHSHTQERINVGGTREALGLASALGAGCFHHMSSIAVAGDHRGTFDESMFARGQGLPSPYHRTKYESERVVRVEASIPWRIYRPALVVGHSETGAMDKVDGPYYFFTALKMLRDSLPQWTPLVGMDLGDTNIVPVDYVARAMEVLAHRPGLDGQTFHLVNPEPQPTVDVINTLATAAGAPRFSVPLRWGTSSRLPGAGALTALSGRLLSGAGSTGPGRLLLRQTLGRLGIPIEVVAHTSLPSVFSSRATQRALAGSGVTCPDLATYAPALWDHWEQHLDTSTARDRGIRRRLVGRVVVISGASSGIGRATALKVAQAGAVPILIARGQAGLDAVATDIELAGGRSHVYACDLSDLDAIDALTKQISEDHESVDVVVNNAGRSIRRSLHLSYDRFHDFERTMQLNYFGAIRLVMGLAPKLSESGGHVVNISSIGVQTNPPRFSAYVASKAALDAWSRVVSSELIGDGVTFTTIHMPLVKTPMIAPTRIYDAFPTITPAQAADHVLRAIRDEPHEINTLLGTAGEVVHTLTPKTMFRVLHLAFNIFPDSAAATGDSESVTPSSEQLLLAKVLKGVHW